MRLAPDQPADTDVEKHASGHALVLAREHDRLARLVGEAVGEPGRTPAGPQITPL